MRHLQNHGGAYADGGLSAIAHSELGARNSELSEVVAIRRLYQSWQRARTEACGDDVREAALVVVDAAFDDDKRRRAHELALLLLEGVVDDQVRQPELVLE